MYICHVFACFWYYVGIMECEAVLSCPLPQYAELEGGCPCNVKPLAAEATASVNATEPALPWVVSSATTGWNDDTDRFTKYLTSFYWAMTTLSTVGYGDISATTNSERAFAICAELFGCFLFGVLLGTLNSVMLGQKVRSQ